MGTLEKKSYKAQRLIPKSAAPVDFELGGKITRGRGRCGGEGTHWKKED